MCNNQGTVSYLRSVCFVSAHLGSVLHYTVNYHKVMKQGEKILRDVTGSLQKYVHFYLPQISLKIEVFSKMFDRPKAGRHCELHQAVFIFS